MECSAVQCTDWIGVELELQWNKVECRPVKWFKVELKMERSVVL